MKFFKSSILAAAALFLGVAFTACSDDKDPEYIAGAGSTGLYVSPDESTTIEINKLAGATSFDVTVSRYGLTDAATYPIKFTAPEGTEGLFNFPGSVSFAQGATEAIVNIPCNIDEMPYDTKYALTLSFGEGTPVYLYGRDVYQFTLAVPAAWSDWKPFHTGDCCWYYDLEFLFDGDDPGLPIWYRQDQVNLNRYEFHIEHWAENVDLYFYWDSKENNIEVPLGQECAYLTSQNLHVYFSDIATVTAELGQANPFEEYPSFYDETTGTFYFNAFYYTIKDGEIRWWEGSYGGYETCQVGGFADYSLEISYKGLFSTPQEDSYAVLASHVGDAYTSAKVMVSKELTPAQILAQIAAGNEDAVTIAQGDLTTNVPVVGAGKYNAVLVGFDGETMGENVATTTFTISGANVSEHNWQPYGTGGIMDGWITYIFAPFTGTNGVKYPYDELIWSFPVEYDAAQKGVYRLVNVWGQPSCPLNQVKANECTTIRNIIIDASEPECVIMTPQLSGFYNSDLAKQIGGDEIYVANLPGYFMTKYDGLTTDELLAEGYGCPLEDDIITVDACLFGASVEECGYTWKDEPVGLIALSSMDDNGVIAKYKAKQNLKDCQVVKGITNQLTRTSLPANVKKINFNVVSDNLKNIPFRF